MRILVGWDDPCEAETLELILNVDANVAKVVTDPSVYEDSVKQGGWDVLVQALSFPDPSRALELFERVHSIDREIPIIGVWRQNEIAELAGFMSHGLHSHLMRDSDQNFALLITSMATAAQSELLSRRKAQLAEKLRQEMDSVRKLQESVIPHDLPRPSGYNLAARYESSQIHVSGIVPVAMAGGDYYDVFQQTDDSMVLLVGDASGHGVKACMSIMTMHTLIRMIDSRLFDNTADFVSEVNRRLCESDVVQDEGGFITLLYSSLHLGENMLQWTSAGSPVPLLQDLITNEVTALGNERNTGLPLAIDADWGYERFETFLPPNSRLLIYTDGLDEAFPIEEESYQQFGVEGIIASLKSSAHLELEGALDHLFSDSNAFTGGHGRADDTSVLLIERTE